LSHDMVWFVEFNVATETVLAKLSDISYVEPLSRNYMLQRW